MKTWNADRCSCCKEIWIREKLKPVSLGTHKLYFCPDCYEAYKETIRRVSENSQRNAVTSLKKKSKGEFCAFIKGAEIVCAACEHANFDCAHCKVMATGKKLADDEMHSLIQEWQEKAMCLYDDLVSKYKEVFSLTEPIIPFNRKTPWLLGQWAETDLSCIIRKASDPVKRKDEILAFIHSYPCSGYFLTRVDMDKVMQDAMIRRDWETALRVHSCDELVSMVSYQLGQDDLKELAALHKKRKFRRKIKDLLTACNFHGECGDFAEGRYDKYLK